MRAVGIPLLIIGVVLVVDNFINFCKGTFKEAQGNALFFIAG